MLFLRNSPKNTFPLFLALAGLILAFAYPALSIPDQQDAGQQTAIFTGVTVSATPTTTVVACGQGSGAIGRKTLAVHNGPAGTGAVTVTAELRDDQSTPNFTSGYLAVNNVATNTASSDTSTPSEPGGRYCQISAFALVTGVVTVTLRRE